MGEWGWGAATHGRQRWRQDGYIATMSKLSKCLSHLFQYSGFSNKFKFDNTEENQNHRTSWTQINLIATHNHLTRILYCQHSVLIQVKHKLDWLKAKSIDVVFLLWLRLCCLLSHCMHLLGLLKSVPASPPVACRMHEQLGHSSSCRLSPCGLGTPGQLMGFDTVP